MTMLPRFFSKIRLGHRKVKDKSVLSSKALGQGTVRLSESLKIHYTSDWRPLERSMCVDHSLPHIRNFDQDRSSTKQLVLHSTMMDCKNGEHIAEMWPYAVKPCLVSQGVFFCDV
mmetsp:Transcript_7389/g.20243  ORF Transcript_7389/g.20243 Transcript_7389/m.20243 type:complete len:115 (-) Transcript_7389:88-432(-)